MSVEGRKQTLIKLESLPCALPLHLLQSNIFSTNLMAFSLLMQGVRKHILKLVISAVLEGIHCYDPLIHKGLQHYESNYCIPSQYGITQREIDVLNQLLKGLRLRSVAQILGIKLKTTKTHLNNIRKKLGLNHNREIIDFIRKAHWCDFNTGEIVWQ